MTSLCPPQALSSHPFSVHSLAPLEEARETWEAWCLPPLSYILIISCLDTM